MKIIYFVCFLATVSYTQTENPYELKYNFSNNTFSFEPVNSALQYNPIDNSWEYVQPNFELKFNPIELQWEYVSQGICVPEYETDIPFIEIEIINED